MNNKNKALFDALEALNKLSYNSELSTKEEASRAESVRLGNLALRAELSERLKQ